MCEIIYYTYPLFDLKSCVQDFLMTDCRKKEWLDLVQRENFTVTKSSRFCSAHFRSSKFVEAPEKLILKDNARPSIFNFPTTPIKKGGRKKLIGIVLFSSSNSIDHSYSRPNNLYITLLLKY